jgi:hypothetical protein
LPRAPPTGDADPAVARRTQEDLRAETANSELCRGHYEKNGIGADYIDRLFR